MFKKIIISFTFIIFCNNAMANLVTYNGYTLDETSNIVTDGTTEWLQWDETSGMSISAALTQYAADGWELATNQQMATLFNQFGFGVPAISALEDGVQQRNLLPSNLYVEFTELFGFVSTYNDKCDPANVVFCLGSDTGSEHPLYLVVI